MWYCFLGRKDLVNTYNLVSIFTVQLNYLKGLFQPKLIQCFYILK